MSNLSWSPSVIPCTDLKFMSLSLSLTTFVFVFPLVVSVLYLGSRRCRRRGAVMSHSDFFTFNSAVVELIGLVGSFITVAGFLFGAPESLFMCVSYLSAFLWFGQMVFPILTCVDRYLAVVHPITYLRLRQGAGVRIRNASATAVWLQGFGGPLLIHLAKHDISFMPFLSVSELLVFLSVVLFCSLSILRVLIRPRPGDRQRVDRSKQRAFRTMLIIMGVLLLRFGGTVVCYWLYTLQQMTVRFRCVMLLTIPWLALPSSLVLLLLFLHKAGKLPGCSHRTGPDPR